MKNNYFIKREFCQACNSQNINTIYSCEFLESPIKEFLESFYYSQGGIEFQYLKDAEYILDECNNCGLIYQRLIPNDFLMRKLYNEWIDPDTVLKYHNERADLNIYAKYAHEIMTLIAYFDTSPNLLSFLDFGMGWGKWCLMAKAFGCNSYGAELSESRIEHARFQGIEVINWDEIPNYQFDYINTEHVFEHIPKPLETLCYLIRSLKQNGLIKINVPDGNSIKNKINNIDWSTSKKSRKYSGPISPLEHINCFNRNSLIKMADVAGLVPVKIPLKVQYIYATNWRPVKQLFKNILIPLYRNVLQKGTSIFFRKKNNK